MIYIEHVIGLILGEFLISVLSLKYLYFLTLKLGILVVSDCILPLPFVSFFPGICFTCFFFLCIFFFLSGFILHFPLELFQGHVKFWWSIVISLGLVSVLQDF